MGEATTILASTVTADMLKGVLNEVVGVLPIVIPALLAMLGIRKGISFVIGSMRAA